jgi:hypothetical protein
MLTTAPDVACSTVTPQRRSTKVMKRPRDLASSRREGAYRFVKIARSAFMSRKVDERKTCRVFPLTAL